MRRRLGWWRAVAILIGLALCVAVFQFFLSSQKVSLSQPHIAELTISGLITDDTALLEKIQRIRDDDSVRALIVSLSTGGGTTYGGEQLYKALRSVAEEKPVVSAIRTEAASAGYMIALAGERIFAGDTSITGSIGVIFMYPQAKELMDKIGVSMDAIKSAPLKAEPSPFNNASPEAQSMIRALVMDSYDWFVDLVAERRGLSHEDALALADGRVLSGRQALDVGLVDEIGGRAEIRDYLTEDGVPESLEIISWDDVNKSRFGLSFGAIGASLVEAVWPGRLLTPNVLGQIGLVDGLVSLRQDH